MNPSDTVVLYVTLNCNRIVVYSQCKYFIIYITPPQDISIYFENIFDRHTIQKCEIISIVGGSNQTCNINDH